MLNGVRNGQVWNFIRKTAVGEREENNKLGRERKKKKEIEVLAELS